jgi:MbtH protein
MDGFDTFVVVVNDEEQFSIFPRDLPCPQGWKTTEFSGTKEMCLEHISKIWTDMRPKSVRNS